MTAAPTPANKLKTPALEVSPAHYFQVIIHRKWIVLTIFAAVTIGTVIYAARLPNVYTSETVILVDPPKIPEVYVKPTVTGDVRNRLGTLTQQVLSVTRLQKVIESFGLYPNERKKLAREDVIALMRSKINVAMVTGGTPGSLEAFRITYSGGDPRMVAQVTNQIATLFIDENLKAREQQATGTTDFLQQQLDETRKKLEAQEAQLRDFRMKHLGEMPEHQVANLTVIGQLQASMQQESEALSRAEQQKSYLQSMMAQFAPVVDYDDSDRDTDLVGGAPAPAKQPGKAAAPVSTPADDRSRLAALLAKYTDSHPEVRKLRAQIADREAKEGRPAAPTPVETVKTAPPEPTREAAAPRRKPTPNSSNPVLVSQLKAVEAEIVKHKEERERISKSLSAYRVKLEAIPVREQQIAELVRDYEINKGHYAGLLNKQLSAETATQLEIRNKGEQFYVLDRAEPAQRPSSPNRTLIGLVGAVAGLVLGLVAVIAPEFAGGTFTSPDQIPLFNGNRILEIIPVIVTSAGAVRRKRKRIILAAVSGVAATLLCGALVIYRSGWLRN
jgi:polysaccharide chain length determinant protein (PEP-CTERM system associated)